MSEQNERFEEGTTTVFADLGFPDPQTHLLKAQLVDQVRQAMAEGRMTEIAAAKATGITQLKISGILKGQFRDVSVERLMRMLTRLGCEVDIVVRPQGRSAPSDVIHFTEAMPA